VARTANSPGMLAWSLAFWSTVTNDYQPRAPHPRRNAEAPAEPPGLGNIVQQVRNPRRRVAPPGVVLPRCRRSASEPADAGVGNVRRRPRPLREIQPRQRRAASHRTGRPGVRLGDRRTAPVGRAGPTLVESRTA